MNIKKTAALIFAAVFILLSFASCTLSIQIGGDKETPAEGQTVKTTEAPEETNAPEETAAMTEAPTEAPTAAPETEAPTTSAPQTTKVVVVETAPQTEKQIVTLHPGETYMVGGDTPDHAGLVLRGGPGSSYSRLTVVSEGTIIKYNGQCEGDYVLVEYYLGGTHYSGWVMYTYLADDHSGGDYYNGGSPASSYPTARISYQTPGHAGLVLRSEATSSSVKLGVLPEGTLLYLLGETRNDYTHVRTSDGTEGWVMTVYLN